jgi:hypothetical protein
LRTVYRYWAWLLFGLIVLQIGLAGYGAFNAVHKADKAHHDDQATVTLGKDTVEDGFGPHAGLGTLLLLLILLFLIVAAIGGIRGRRLKLTGLLFVLMILQVALAWIGFDQPVVGFFHPINALVLFGLTGYLAFTGKRDDSLAPGTDATTGPAPAPAV